MIDSISPYSILTFNIIFFGYIINTSILQYFFYTSSTFPSRLIDNDNNNDDNKDNNDSSTDMSGQTSSNITSLTVHKITNNDNLLMSWKIQSNKLDNVGRFYGWPILSNKPNRGDYHRIITFINLILASFVAGFTTECSVRQLNYIRYDKIIYIFSSLNNIILIIFEILLAILCQSILEYYWHRIMHFKYFYKLFHKYHHYYKSPEPWDDMYIHPIEAFGYYCILYGPPFYLSLHYLSFIVYMIIMGICGILDHSGIFICIPYIYNTKDHDKHHSKFNVNYSFPFPFMDILHQTYDREREVKQ